MYTEYSTAEQRAAPQENISRQSAPARRAAPRRRRSRRYDRRRVLLIGMALVLPVRSAYLGTLEHLLPGMEAGSLLAAWITGLFLFILVSAANVLAIRRKVQAIWLKKK